MPTPPTMLLSRLLQLDSSAITVPGGELKRRRHGRDGSSDIPGAAKLIFGSKIPPIVLGSGRGRIKRKVKKPPSSQASLGSKRKTSEGASSSSSALATASPRSVEVGSNEDAPPAATPPNDSSGTHEDEVIVIDDDHSLAKRDKKRTSVVWQYFEKEDVEGEVDGKIYKQKWGFCKFPNCKARYRCEGRYGTTGFLNHLKSSHNIVKGQQQLSLVKDYEKAITVVEPYRYDPIISLRKFYLAIIMHEYPFNIVEHEYLLVEFIKSLRPNFPIKSRITTIKDIMDIYLEQRDILYDCLKNVQCRFSATMDMWTSCQNKSYMCVTLHWIDDECRIQKRIVGFFHVEGSHTGQKLSQTFNELMVKWYTEKKLFSLTLDNASVNEVAVNDIIADLNENHGSLVCDGLFFHVRCACHILNLVARDGMVVISGTIDNIKKLILTVKGSSLQWEELMKRAKECGLDTSKGLSLNVSTRWNSTYLMLRDALYYKCAFMRLKSSDCHKYESITPPEEWDMALKIFHLLKKFYGLTEILSGTSYPTANQFYKGFCDIKELLDRWCRSNDFVIKKIATAMSEKFEKYRQKSSIALAMACFLDPRYKKRLIEYYMNKFYGPLGHDNLEYLVSIIKIMYKCYASSAPTPSKEKASAPQHCSTDDLLMETHDDELDHFLYDTSGADLDELSELDKYLAAPLLKHSGGHFGILSWWQDKKREYPVLSQIACDVLAIQVSTVAGGHIIDPYRSRLDLEMVQALICTKDWIAAARKDSKHVTSLVADLDILEDFATYLKPKNEEVNEEENDESDPDDMNDVEELLRI